MADASSVELPQFSAEECHVHVRIPAATTLGHRADSWNVAKPDYTCLLRTLLKGDTLILRLLTEEGELFAEAHWQPEKPMLSVRAKAITMQTALLQAMLCCACVGVLWQAQLPTQKPACVAMMPLAAWPSGCAYEMLTALHVGHQLQ